jgi:hypothetical protein
MLVTDLHHFLDLPADTAGAVRRLAEHLSNVVRSATAGDAGTTWESALPCRRRPANRRCRGRIIVLQTDSGVPIRWQCSVCDDEGMINNWEDSPFDLRRRRLTLAGAVNEIVILMRWPRRCASCSCWTPTANDWCSRSAPTPTALSSLPPTTTWTS